MTPLEAAKDKLTIPGLWEMRGWPGKPGKACRVPWRDDRTPSGSVFSDGLKFRDFTSDETFDAPGLLARVEDLSPGDACRLFIQLSGVDRQACDDHRFHPPAPRPVPAPIPLPTPELPQLDVPTTGELCQLAAIRFVSVPACIEAARRGHLFSANWWGHRCWIITDAARHSAQARRLDGKPFVTRDGNSIKAVTLPGSSAAWLIGAPSADACTKRLILCEGGGDFLAAYHFSEVEGTLAEVQPVVMLGAAQRIHAESLPFLSGKPTRIFPHLDRAGEGAAFRWETQLKEAGIPAHCFDLSGLTRDDEKPVNDLNDLTRIGYDEFENNRELWSLTTF